MQPDHNALPYGVTTAVDAGDGGAKEFDHPKTRVLAFVRADTDQAKVLKGAGFSFRTGAAAIRAGRLPEIVATGIDSNSVLLIRANMMTTLSKLLNLGMTVDQMVERTTVNPARAHQEPADLERSSEGAVADIAVIEMRTRCLWLSRRGPAQLAGDRRLHCVLTIRNGVVVWDGEGAERARLDSSGALFGYVGVSGRGHGRPLFYRCSWSRRAILQWAPTRQTVRPTTR